MTKPNDQDQGLADWRKENWKRVLVKVGTTLEGIMDNPDSTPRDRNEAARTLARIANILTPEKVDEPTRKAKTTQWWEEELTEDEQRQLDSIVNPAKT